MHKRTRLALALTATAALVAVAAAPAQAAVTYSTTSIAVANVGVAATDTSTGTIYVGQQTTRTIDGVEADVATVAVINGTTRKQTALIQVNTGDLDAYQPSVVDIRVRPQSHTVWVLTSSYPGFGYVWEIDGTTNKVVRHVASGGYASSLALEQGGDRAFWVTWTGYDEPSACDEDTQIGTGKLAAAAKVSSINGTTGDVASATLPVPSTIREACTAYRGTQVSTNIAFDSANRSLQIVGSGYVWALTTGLRLAHTLDLKTDRSLGATVTADGTRNSVFVVDPTAVYLIDGATGRLTKKVTATSDGLPVIDPSIHTLYVGTAVYGSTTLGRAGTIPKPAQAVNGTTHAIYSSDGAKSVFITTRKA